MAGTPIGGKRAAAKNLAKDPDFYKRIGSMGGKNGKGTLKGFAADPELASKFGRIGGMRSKRKKNVQKTN